jgi:hypothetical protein
MENNPRSDADYVVITVRFPVKLFAQLVRWLVMAAASSLLLHH